MLAHRSDRVKPMTSQTSCRNAPEPGMTVTGLVTVGGRAVYNLSSGADFGPDPAILI
jgi:hypothetical protein